jgi:uncharacterized protein (DUF488 family)
MLTLNPAYTLGHSSHPLWRLVEILDRHRIRCLIDVRSQPYSRAQPHFCKDVLRQNLERAGYLYRYLGDHLGGRPDGNEFYDPDGHARYDRIAAAPRFQDALVEAARLVVQHRSVLLCAEAEPRDCHRRRLLGPALADRGLDLVHILPDGSLRTEAEFQAGESGAQAELFPRTSAGPWRSILPVR